MNKVISVFVFAVATYAIGSAQETQKEISSEFNHVALHVRDLPRSTAFYRDVLGLKRIADPFNDGAHAFLQIGNSAELHLIAGARMVPEQHIDVHMAFRVSSVEQFVDRLHEKGIAFVNARRESKRINTRPDGVKQIYFQDPDGYWIEVNNAGYRVGQN
jgi:lactoylglutathione lyase